MNTVVALGCTITYVGDDVVIHESISRTWHDDTTGRAPQSWTIQISHLKGSDRPAEVSAAASTEGHRGIRFIADGDETFWGIAPGGQAAHLAIGDTGAVIRLEGTPFRAWDVLDALVSEALSASGLLRIHCSASATTERGYLYLGPSGRGKTTTMLRAVAAGHRPIAEDLCWLDPTSMTLFPTDRSVKITPHMRDTAGLFPTSAVWTPTGQGKLSTPMETFGGVAHGRRLTDVVLLDRSPTRDTAWTPMSGTEAVLALYAAVGAPNTVRQRDFVGTSLGALTKTVRCSTLRLGRTPIQF